MWRMKMINMTLITILLNFDSADLSSMEDACHIRTQSNDLALHEFSYLSGIERPPGVRGGHGFVLSELRIFLCPMLVLCWSIHLSQLIVVSLEYQNTSYKPSSRAVLYVTDRCFPPSIYDPSARCEGHKSKGKTTIPILQYGPRKGG